MEKKNYLVFLLIVYLFIYRQKFYYGVDKKIGRGVFCNNIIFPGEIIEVCPTLEVDYTDNSLNSYIFKNNNYLYVGFGVASMFNHNDNPNVRWVFNKDNDIVFQATKFIFYGQQLTIDYGNNYWKYRKDKI